MEIEKLTNEESKRLLQKLQTDEKFQKDFVKGMSIIIKDRIERDEWEHKRYAHYVFFTPLWKQLWHKVIGVKPYKQHDYMPTYKEWFEKF
jgi:hypothetical protein